MSIELNRVGWEDEPSTKTPIDSGNLKQMENNTQETITKLEELIEKITPITLWTGDTNDVSTITLSDNVSNYLRIKVFFYDNNGQKGSSEIDNSNKANEISFSLTSFYNSSQYFNVKMKSLKFSGNKIVGIGQANYEFGTKEISYNNNIYITKIEGYKS